MEDLKLISMGGGRDMRTNPVGTDCRNMLQNEFYSIWITHANSRRYKDSRNHCVSLVQALLVDVPLFCPKKGLPLVRQESS